MKNSILITGGCGFIGAHVVQAASNLGYSIKIIDNLTTGSEKNINFNDGNIELLNNDIPYTNEF